MDYRKELEKYYEYLGNNRPVHKMITNHLVFFADWLNNKPDASQSVPAQDGEGRAIPNTYTLEHAGGETTTFTRRL